MVIHGQTLWAAWRLYSPIPILVLSIGLLIGGTRQPVSAQVTLADATSQEWKFLGAGRCKRCHEQPDPSLNDNHTTIRFNEYTVWKNQDKHSRAYAVLLDPRSQRMAELLGFEKPAHQEKACLNCHSMEYLPADRRGRAFKIEEGVACESCHGPAAGWETAHQELAWKEYSGAKKEQDFGFYNVFDPVRRAKVCVSCHVGSVSEGKVLEHRFYAAGHPPLPSFELDTFSQNMPPHWIQRWKAARDQRQDLIRGHFILAGALASYAESMRFVGDAAKTNAGADYTFYDCYACHHEFRPQPNWRTRRGFRTDPGRPLPRTWPSPLARLAIEESNRIAEFQALEAKLLEAFTHKPFGDPVQVSAAALALANWGDQVAQALTQKLETERLSPQKAIALLRKLCALPASATVECSDYDSYRQIAWAVRSLYEQLEPKPTRRVEIEKHLHSLEIGLSLDLPSGTDRSILEALPGTLNTVAAFDRTRFESIFEDLAALFK